MPLASTPQLRLDRENVVRVVINLLQHELTLLRPGTAIPPVSEWSVATNLYDSPYGIDSLERLSLGSAVSEVFHLYETVSEDRLLRSGKVGDWVETVLTSLAQFSLRMTFRTSGSMGRPRRCVHDWSWFEQEVPSWAALFEGRQRIVSHVPPHHIYGFLNTVLLPQCMGIPVVDARIDHTVQLESGDLLISFPERLGLLASSGRVIPAGLAAVSSTAPLPPATASALRAKGLESLLEMYGSSETGGLAYRFHSADPFTLLPYLTPSANGDLIRTDSGGKTRAVELPDMVRWVDERNFHVERRKDGAVQVGGINVYPQSVADRLAVHHLLAQAFVRPTEIRGQQRLKALLVFEHPMLDTAAHRQQLLDWIRGEFRAEERPVVLTFGEAPPRNDMGKLTDWTVDEQELITI